MAYLGGPHNAQVDTANNTSWTLDNTYRYNAPPYQVGGIQVNPNYVGPQAPVPPVYPPQYAIPTVVAPRTREQVQIEIVMRQQELSLLQQELSLFPVDEYEFTPVEEPDTLECPNCHDEYVAIADDYVCGDCRKRM